MHTLKSAKMKRSALAAAIALSLGVGAMTMDSAQATPACIAGSGVVTFSYSGLFTMLQPAGTGTSSGAPLKNTPYKTDSYAGYRTPISGTMCFNTSTGTGTGTVNSFKFFSSTAVAAGVELKAIGNGSGGAGTLILGNMLFNWNGNNGIPVSIVLDGAGLFTAMNAPGFSAGTVINQSSAGDVLPASNYMDGGTYQVGVVPVATTTWNTTLVGAACTGTSGASCMGRNPSGALPLIADTAIPAGYSVATTGIGGNPMAAGPFQGYNANFDITSMTVTTYNGLSAPPSVQTESPAPGAPGVDPLSTTISATFTFPMSPSSVASAFTLETNGTPVAGTISANSNDTVFTFTPTTTLSYSTTYTANVSTTATKSDGTPLSAAENWSFTTEAQPIAATCTGGGPAPTLGTGSNFTMLQGNGTAFGGTNDVLWSYSGSPNTTVNGINFDMTISSVTPFFGFPWSAHDIRAFGPGTYTFNTGCTVAELHAGDYPYSSQGSPYCADTSGTPLTLTVNSGQLGALMLFNWNTTDNIYVAEVWNQNAKWQSGPGAENGMWIGPTWGGPAGYQVNPNTTWEFASTPGTTNGINGIPMVNGPFIGFSANFNLGATDSCNVAASAPIAAHDTGVSGCSISATPVNPFKRSDWFILLGFVGWLGWWRRKRRS